MNPRDFRRFSRYRAGREPAGAELALKTGVAIVVSGSIDRRGKWATRFRQGGRNGTGKVIDMATSRPAKDQVVGAATKLSPPYVKLWRRHGLGPAARDEKSVDDFHGGRRTTPLQSRRNPTASSKMRV